MITIRVPNVYPTNWKEYWLSLPQNKWLCSIPEKYITEKFNLFGLEKECSYFKQCVNVIIGEEKLENLSVGLAEKLMNELLPKAYGLIHQRYIMSPSGIKQMERMYKNAVYGVCPRVMCNKEHLLPYGESSTLSSSRSSCVKALCPKCRKLYMPRPKLNMDGAYFGPNIAHIIIDDLDIVDTCANCEKFHIKIYGYRMYDQREEDLKEKSMK